MDEQYNVAIGVGTDVSRPSRPPARRALPRTR